MQDEQWPPESLMQMMTRLSEGDISVLAGAVSEQMSMATPALASISTTVGSPNYKFWTQLAEIGLLKEDGPLPLKELADVRIFAVVKAGVPRIETLLETYRRRVLFGKMKYFFEKECEPFAHKIVERVTIERGGTPEIIMLMGLFLASVVTKSFPEQKDCERVIKPIAEFALKRLQGTL
jgi:hypothetical protein